MRRVEGLIVLGLALAGCDTALVGGDCSAGYANVDGVCVEQDTDEPTGLGGTGGSRDGVDSGTGGDADSVLGWPVQWDRGTGGAGGSSDAPPQTAGHVVVLGFDPAVNETGRTILTNAVLLSLHEPVRVATLGTKASMSADAYISAAVAVGVESRGRHAVVSPTPLVGVPNVDLEDLADVLILSSAALDKNRALDPGWGEATRDFCRHGGILIAVVEPPGGPAMGSFLSESELVPGVAALPIKSQALAIAVWTDALAVGTVSPFDSGGLVTGFVLPAGSDVASVAVSDDGTPVLIHRALPPSIEEDAP